MPNGVMDPEAKAENVYPGRAGKPSNPAQHEKCMKRLRRAIESSAYVKFMLEAMKKAGCEVCTERHLVCEPCGPTVAGGYDELKQQLVLCENNIYSQGSMNETLTHELVHSYDHCRAHVDWDNILHLACSEIRAANLSGECFFWKENFARLKFGWKKHHQACVRERAAKSLLCVRDISEEQAYRAVDKVFAGCFKDTDPFERVPP